MRILLSILSLSLLASSAVANRVPNFVPERSSSLDTPLGRDFPALYDLRQPLLSSSDNGGGSWWTSTFLKSSNGTSYILISHVTLIAGTGYYRASLLDLDTLSLYKQFYESVIGISTSENGLFKISILDKYGFQAQNSDGLPVFRTWACNDEFSFNITFKPTSPIIYNAGAGGFLWGTGMTYQFSIPSALTTGTFQVGTDNEELTIDENNSFTWLDRQWGPGLPLTGNFTWFQLHFGKTKISIWATDNTIPYQRSRFATVRHEDGSMDIRPIVFKPDYTRTYKSTRLSLDYATAWTVKFLGPEGGSLRIVSPRENQEMVGDLGLTSSYTGYVTATGEFGGKTVSGFGATEVIDFLAMAGAVVAGVEDLAGLVGLT